MGSNFRSREKRGRAFLSLSNRRPGTLHASYGGTKSRPAKNMGRQCTSNLKLRGDCYGKGVREPNLLNRLRPRPADLHTLLLHVDEVPKSNTETSRTDYQKPMRTSATFTSETGHVWQIRRGRESLIEDRAWDVKFP